MRYLDLPTVLQKSHETYETEENLTQYRLGHYAQNLPNRIDSNQKHKYYRQM